MYVVNQLCIIHHYPPTAQAHRIFQVVTHHTVLKNSFFSGKLTGMNENASSVDLPSGNQDPGTVASKVYEAANVLQVPAMNETEYKFCAQTIGSGCLVLVKVTASGSKASIVVNCEKMVIGSMLLKDIKSSLSRI
jgi:AP-3 complex subunit beta